MNFTYPAFLFALSAIAIPIIIHLFNFRKFKTVYFSNVKFLKEVKQETQSKSKLKHLLVLIARILAITFLVLAFAQPYIPGKQNQNTSGTAAVSVFIDNSFSMDAINTNGSLLDDAKRKATEIVASYNPADRFQLLTNDFEGKHQRLLTKEEFWELLDEVKISPSSKKLKDIYVRIKDVLNNSESNNKQAYILSDFQKTNYVIEDMASDTGFSMHLIPIVANENANVYIDSCWFETPVRQLGVNEKLHVKLKNISDKTFENNSIKLFINGIQKTPSGFNIQPQSETEVVLAFASKEKGIVQGVVEITDYPVTFDDKFYFSYFVAQNIPVLGINAVSNSVDNNYLSKLFNTDSGFVYTPVSETQIDYAKLKQYNLIILNQLKTVSSGLAQELQKFVADGGSLLVFPGIDADLSSYLSLTSLLKTNAYERIDTLTTSVEQLNIQSPLFKDVFDKKTFSATNLDLPKVFDHYVLSKNTRSTEEVLMKLKNGNSFLSAFEYEKGKVYLSAVPLNIKYSNFSKHALFVATLYKIAIGSTKSYPLYYTIGENNFIEMDNNLTGENVYRLKSSGSNFEYIPEHKQIDSKIRLYVNNELNEAGNYQVNVDKEVVQGVSFNYNRSESDLTCYTANQLKELLEKQANSKMDLIEPAKKSLTQLLKQAEQGTQLWKLCIILALLFLGAESLLLRYMK